MVAFVVAEAGPTHVGSIVETHGLSSLPASVGSDQLLSAGPGEHAIAPDG